VERGVAHPVDEDRPQPAPSLAMRM
jgi:hypothetical protein